MAENRALSLWRKHAPTIQLAIRDVTIAALEIRRDIRRIADALDVLLETLTLSTLTESKKHETRDESQDRDEDRRVPRRDRKAD